MEGGKKKLKNFKKRVKNEERFRKKKPKQIKGREGNGEERVGE